MVAVCPTGGNKPTGKGGKLPPPRDNESTRTRYNAGHSRKDSQFTRPLAPLNEKHGVFLVRDEEAGRMCVKKILKTYNEDVYERLQTSRIKGIPEIYHMQEDAGELTIYEEYISSETVDSMLKNKGAMPDSGT